MRISFGALSSYCRRPIWFVACLSMFSAFINHDAYGESITAEWINTGRGSWKDPANWKDGIVPASNSTNQYDVIFNVPSAPNYVQADLDYNFTVSRLTLGNVLYVYVDTNNSPRAFHIQDYFRWVDGSLSGWACSYHLHGEAIFEGDTDKILDGQCNITIYSHARWTGGNIYWGGYGQCSIDAKALFDIETGGSCGAVGSTDSVNLFNRGTIKMNASGKRAKFYTPFHNTGVLDVEAGDIEMTESYEGPGKIILQPGTHMYISGTGKWTNFPQNCSGEIAFTRRAQDIAGNTTFSGPVRIGADVAGKGSLTLQDAIWDSGTMDGPGSTFIPETGKLRLQTGQIRVLRRNTVNAGEIFLSPGAELLGEGPAVHTNTISGKIHLSSASTFGREYFAIGSLLNQGEILKDDDGMGGAEFTSALQNEGLIRSTAGRLTLSASGKNSGTLEAQAPGSIEANIMDCSDSSALVGNGSISLFGSTLRGSVDTNLNLCLSYAKIQSTNIYTVKSLEIHQNLLSPANGGAEALENMALYGGMTGGLLRSRGYAELSFNDEASIASGARLELLGESAWKQGFLLITDSNSILLNAGTMHVLGSNDLSITRSANFINTGKWKVNRQIGSFKTVLSDSVCRITASDVSPDQPFDDGSFQISGPVVFSPQKIVAGPNAQMTFSQFTATNGSVQLFESSMAVTKTMDSSRTSFTLDQGTIIGPAASWTGSATFKGQGHIQANLALKELQLDAATNNTRIFLNGSLSMAGTNAFMRTTIAVNDRLQLFPSMNVDGQVVLNGSFELVTTFPADSYNLSSGPITILESALPITGSFVNATNGANLVSTNKIFRYKLYYGPNSPFGNNKLVIAEFGTAFDRWSMNRYSNDLANPLVCGPAADPDHNGLNNLTEFVLGVDPINKGIDLPSLHPGTDGYTTIHLRRRKDIGGLQANIGVSSNLTTWQETTIGASPDWMELHRAFDLEASYEYIYRYHGTPSELFLRIIITGQY